MNFNPVRLLLILASIFFNTIVSSAQDGPPLIIREMVTITGTVESVAASKLVIRDQAGKAQTIRIQEIGQNAVPLASGQRLRFPAQVRITGKLPLASLEAGQVLRFTGMLNRLGKASGKVTAIDLVTDKETSNRLRVLQAGEGSNAFSTCEITGTFVRAINGRVVVTIPKDNDFTRRTTLSFPTTGNLLVQFLSNDFHRAASGAQVTQLIAARLNTGDLVAKTLEVKVGAETTSKPDVNTKLLDKYRHLSDAPQSPRLIRSAHFRFMTDVSDRQGQIILDKLETMVRLLTKYFGRAPTGFVDGYIVHDLSKWPEGLLKEPAGIAKIRARAGICFNSSLGNQRRAELYSCDDHGVIQHECTHGFCHLAFGSTGPTWLAEGVAELGQYWKLNQLAVNASPSVLSYLQRAKPKRSLLQIAVPGRTEAGNWQDYAWRWALCHLLANNPNYAPRFKPLAIALMEKREGVSFASVYGPVAKQISFEYDLFLQNLASGYRADLCAWQWNTKFKPLAAEKVSKVKIKAAYGWQASGLQLEKGVSYDLKTTGQWKIAPGETTYDADGDQDGRGQLRGIIFNDYQLSQPVPFGSESTFIAPADGQLFLRCQDDWSSLDDNAGEITVYFRRTPG
ncbi:MAG: hypothetical protein GY917_26395 [Planctomycetaceae bacterium]|nr:hypothetical protein [Planctomycetaceae bacterium]